MEVTTQREVNRKVVRIKKEEKIEAFKEGSDSTSFKCASFTI